MSFVLYFFMNNYEFRRLMGYYYAKKHAPKPAKPVVGKRTAKRNFHLGQGAMGYQNPAPKGVYPTVVPSYKI